MPHGDRDTIVDVEIIESEELRPPVAEAPPASAGGPSRVLGTADRDGGAADRSAPPAPAARPALPPAEEPPERPTVPDPIAAPKAVARGAPRPTWGEGTSPSLSPTASMMPMMRRAEAKRRIAVVAAALVAAVLGIGAALALASSAERAEGASAAATAGGAARSGEVATASVLETGLELVEGRRARSAARAEQDQGVAEAESSEHQTLGIRAGEARPETLSAASEGLPELAAGEARAESEHEPSRVSPRRRSEPSRRRGRPLSGEEVRTTVARNARGIRRCHEREMRRLGMPIQGRVVVRIAVAPSGEVRNASVQSGAEPGSPLASCIEGSVRSWRFPEATATTEVETPFVLAARMP